jgi:hypothetical protein
MKVPLPRARTPGSPPLAKDGMPPPPPPPPVVVVVVHWPSQNVTT